jgi:16S rRNA (guanine966-N2)-methyltransferase
MVRVIAGQFRSRRLKTLQGQTTRPTSDRLKETLFNLLQNRLAGCSFLDCFAGSGSIGIEAISRGAALVVFVESSASAAKVIRSNLTLLGLSTVPGQHLMVMPVERALETLHRKAAKFDIVFLDPPYAATDQYSRVLELLQHFELLADKAMVAAEHSRHFELEPRVLNLARVRKVRQGDSTLSMFRKEGETIITS